jgi:hypothetical protein
LESVRVLDDPKGRLRGLAYVRIGSGRYLYKILVGNYYDAVPFILQAASFKVGLASPTFLPCFELDEDARAEVATLLPQITAEMEKGGVA